MRIIALDDEPDIVRVVELSLRRRGYDVKSFTDPVVALEHFNISLHRTFRVRSMAKKRKLDAKNSIKDGTASFVDLGASSRPTFLRSHTWMASTTS